MTQAINDTRKAELLANTVEHVAIDQLRRPPDHRRHAQDELHQPRHRARRRHLRPMSRTTPTARPWLIAGSTSAGGCMHIYRDMVKYGMIDVVVATGASIVDMDFFEALGFKHYQALDVDDATCARSTSTASTTPISTRKSSRTATTRSTRSRTRWSRAPIRAASSSTRWASGWPGNAKKPDSLIEIAYEEGVPIFCPAFVDSLGRLRPGQAPGGAAEGGQALPDHRRGRRLPRTDRHQDRGRHHRPVHGRRRRAEELRPGHRRLRRDPRPRRAEMHKYAVQITVADVRDGACSSSTLQGGRSWGKVDTGSRWCSPKPPPWCR